MTTTTTTSHPAITIRDETSDGIRVLTAHVHLDESRKEWPAIAVEHPSVSGTFWHVTSILPSATVDGVKITPLRTDSEAVARHWLQFLCVLFLHKAV